MEAHDLLEYAPSNSSPAGAEDMETAPAPSYTAAAVVHPPTNGSGTPAAVKKSPVVHRAGGVPTAMQVHRGQTIHHAVPTPAPLSKAEEAYMAPRTSWTTRESGVASVMSSVARRRGSVAQEPSAARAGSESLPPRQSSVQRCREASRASSANVCQSMDRRRGSVQPNSARARSESTTARGANEPAIVQPFQLLSAGRPVPELPRELEEAVTAYYMRQLHQLSVSDQERIVYAMVAPRDVKAVMTCLKQQDQAGAATAGMASVAPPLGSAHATPARSRGNGVQAHSAPKNAPRDIAEASSRRRVLHEHNDEHHAPQHLNSTPEQKAALSRFYQHFTVEACAAFLDDALDVCIDRRTRCYQEQPRVARDQGVVLPEEHLFPYYTQSVGSLLYNMTGWTQPEARRLSRLVVSIIHDWMPTVVGPTPPSLESSKPQPSTASPASSPQAQRPPVPMAPRPNAPQPVAAA